ncbi:hypothetical protein [Nonomuraea sp. NEAU-A123]|uniref:hypothetical protein n=1 Tax=Nonomuraea sp. NEAU-A123 TaxID=2839649 RepID=UPI001BE46D17|nr:hypothetical protein [Nonomuraea sp. NEAU-A123]
MRRTEALRKRRRSSGVLLSRMTRMYSRRASAIWSRSYWRSGPQSICLGKVRTPFTGPVSSSSVAGTT